MYYNYVDIGTSNFNTSADTELAIVDPSINVLLIEPLDFYLNVYKSTIFEY